MGLKKNDMIFHNFYQQKIKILSLTETEANAVGLIVNAQPQAKLNRSLIVWTTSAFKPPFRPPKVGVTLFKQKHTAVTFYQRIFNS